MPTTYLALQTSPASLRSLLEQTGRRLKPGDKLEKLDLLRLLADQINDKLKSDRKLHLTLSQLNSFLADEGMGKASDCKGVVSKIMELVHRQYVRLGQHVRPKSQEENKSPNVGCTYALDSLLALVVMDSSKVNDVFGLNRDQDLVGHARTSGPCNKGIQPDISSDRVKSSLNVNSPPRTQDPFDGDDNASSVVKAEQTRPQVEPTVVNDGLPAVLVMDGVEPQQKCDWFVPNVAQEILPSVPAPSLMDDVEPQQKRSRVEPAATQDSSPVVLVMADVGPQQKCPLVVQAANQDNCLVVLASSHNDGVEPQQNCPRVLPTLDQDKFPLVPVSSLVDDLKRLVPAAMLAQEDSSENRIFAERRIEAQREIGRIFAADSQGRPILVGETKEDRQVAFRRIVSLLHPDLALVPGDEAQAKAALSLALKAFVESQARE